MSPNLFIGVEFWGVGREAMDLEVMAVPAQIGKDQGTAVDGEPVPEQNQESRNMAPQVAKETDDFLAGDVLMMTMGVQSKPATTRRNRDGRDRRGTISPVTVPQYGGLAHRCPGSTHRGNEPKAAFVQKRQMRPPSLGFFLSGAMSNASIAQWLPRLVESPSVAVSAGSIANRRRVAAKCPIARSGHRSAPRPTCRLAATSTGRWDNPSVVHRAAAVRSAPTSVPASGGRVAPASVVPSTLGDRLGDTLDTSAPPNSRRTAPGGPHRGNSRPSATFRWPDTVVVPTAERFHMVSWNPVYHRCRLVSIAL